LLLLLLLVVNDPSKEEAIDYLRGGREGGREGGRVSEVVARQVYACWWGEGWRGRGRDDGGGGMGV